MVGISDQVVHKAEALLRQLVQGNPSLACYIDDSLPIPKVFAGDGEIKLIVLGQDPAVKKPESRKMITTVLNLDKEGSLRRYLGTVSISTSASLGKKFYKQNLASYIDYMRQELGS